MVSALCQAPLQSLAAQQRGRDLLAHAVVQFVAETAALLVADVRHLTLQALPLAHFPFQFFGSPALSGQRL